MGVGFRSLNFGQQKGEWSFPLSKKEMKFRFSLVGGVMEVVVGQGILKEE